MCVKIFTGHEAVSYDMEQPLETQLAEATEVVINYESEDPAIGKFLKEIERCTRSGISLDLNIKVLHNDHLDGARVMNKAKKLCSDVNVNELIKMFTLSYHEADKKLEDIKNCLEKEDSVR